MSQNYGRFMQYGGMGGAAPEEWFEVFISGKGYPYHLANISSSKPESTQDALQRLSVIPP